MVFEIKKQEKENSQGLIRRFTRRIQQSGLLLRIRKSKFRKKNKSRELLKKAALRREELRQEYKEMAKMGKEVEPKYKRR
ncbi:MAG: hypothetical protein ABH919_01955 [bacterium]